MIAGFIGKYGAGKLVYFEEVLDILITLRREKCLNEWPRKIESY